MSSAVEAFDINSVQRSPENAVEMPRSRRVGMASPPSGFKLEGLNYETFPSPPASPTLPSSPPLPVRSPLRPPARSISGASTETGTTVTNTNVKSQGSLRPATPPPLEIDDIAAIVDAAMPQTFQMHHRNFAPLGGMSVDTHAEVPILSKALPLPPDSPLSVTLEDETTNSSSSSVMQHPPVSKRYHALHELLSSERAYASDLALVRDVHVPLALGQPVSLSSVMSSATSSPSSSRSVSTISEGLDPSLGPPMTIEDTRAIFSNIAELATFSDQFCIALEEALGSMLEGGEGEDHVGALFLAIIPEMERPYKHYITRHPGALTHLQSLPQTPVLVAYLAHTQNIASSLSHAWDLASLLIKPVQRLLKYPLLLSAIIDETPDSHSDRENLKLARTKLEEVARNVNEGRRRAEVVKEVLTTKKKVLNVGVTTSVTRIKSLRHNSKPSISAEPNEEAARVARMQAELKKINLFATRFAKNILDWAKDMSKVVLALRAWAINFGKVIGLSDEQGSEAFDAFHSVIEDCLLPLTRKLETDLNEKVLKNMAYLLSSMTEPLKLLASMDEQEPLHLHLLTMNVSAKNRPPASLLAASTNYVALRGQLAAELPQYLALFHKGLAVLTRRLAQVQAEFWRDIRDRWAELWDMLRVEGEMNAGHEETVSVWKSRFCDVEELVSSLSIVQQRRFLPELRSAATSNILASLDPYHAPGRKTGGTNASSGLLPLEMPIAVSNPLPLARSPKTRSRGASDASNHASKKNLGRKPSNEAMVSPSKSAGVRLHRKKGEDSADATPPHPHPGAIPRTKSMPLPSAERPDSHRTSSSSKTLVGDADNGVYVQEPYEEAAADRGRDARKPSLRRKLTDSIRPSNRGRSSSKSKSASYDDYDPTRLPPSPPAVPPVPAQSASQRDSWVTKRAKYVCQVIYACQPPAAVSYFSFPFFTLVEGDLYEVLQEAGHPSIHPKLPLYVDDGEDCLLLCRDQDGDVGWALASFLTPLNLTVE